MNYSSIYSQVIERALCREKPDCYCEKHHIIPKSMGGSDKKENIALLTAREHFIAHWLLKKIHKNKSMTYAFFAMTKKVGNGRARYTSHSFKYAKESMAKWLTENRSGKNNHWYGVKGKDNIHTGMKRSQETKNKISEKAKERYLNSPHHNSRVIVCVETGERFESISEAKQKQKHKGNISYALKTGGTAGGFHFAYEGKKFNKKINNYASGERHPMVKKKRKKVENLI